MDRRQWLQALASVMDSDAVDPGQTNIFLSRTGFVAHASEGGEKMAFPGVVLRREHANKIVVYACQTYDQNALES